MSELLGVFVIGAGAATTFIGGALRNKRLAMAGVAIMASGGLVELNSSSPGLRQQQSNPNLIYSGPASAATEIFGGTNLDVDAIYLPTSTRMSFPSPTVTVTTTPTPTETPVPTNTALPTVTSTPSTPQVNLETAKAACHEEDYPEWLKKVYIRQEIVTSFNNVTENCVDKSVVVDSETGKVHIQLKVNKTDTQYNDHGFLDVIVPIELEPGSYYKIEIEACDDECELSLHDAGDVIIGEAVTAQYGDEPQSKIIFVEGQTSGFGVFRLIDRIGDSIIKATVEKVIPQN